MLINKKYNRAFLYWLFSLIILVIIMIVIGGLTRLTGSGLSITEWDLFRGILPPLNENEWEHYFSLYKTIPQYNLLNKGMSLEDFKYIYLWEYVHRILGRIIGLFFLIPFIFFVLKKIISKEHIYKFVFLFFLILLQGLMGWYMVESGLVNDITVSHYRLSLHLFLAFFILSSLLWHFFNFISLKKKNFFNNSLDFFSIKIFIFLLFLQITLGAFVSGLDAGKIYQTWPLMNSSYFPDDVILDKFSDLIDFEKASLLQFFHRNLAYLIFFITLYMGFFILKSQKINLIKPYIFLFLFVVLQIILGIFTLLTDVNMAFASSHQISSIFLMIFSLNLYHRSIE